MRTRQIVTYGVFLVLTGLAHLEIAYRQRFTRLRLLPT